MKAFSWQLIAQIFMWLYNVSTDNLNSIGSQAAQWCIRSRSTREPLTSRYGVLNMCCVCFIYTLKMFLYILNITILEACVLWRCSQIKISWIAWCRCREWKQLIIWNRYYLGKKHDYLEHNYCTLLYCFPRPVDSQTSCVRYQLAVSYIPPFSVCLLHLSGASKVPS